ncbi:two-component regulator propeller domain-containing protein [Pedobacter lithocola]|uniref:histidine kinase n=1 Tax=Pedobacter lithocola TaxID=1908239 RepID=A0ABV8PFI4_9SPHI
MKFKYLTREEGLSSSTVSNVFQDSQGYIWLGTEDGLNRFDGYNVTVYKNEPHNESSLSSNFINYILEDKQHRIWVATSYGLNLYDRYTDSFTRYIHDPKKKGSISNNLVYTLYLDVNGDVWVGTDFGLNKYNEKQNNFITYLRNPNAQRESLEDKINSINEDEFNNLYLGTDGAGVKKFNKKTKSFINQPSNSALSKLDGSRVITIKKDNQNHIWLGTNGKGLFVFDPQKNTIKHYQNEQYNTKSLSNNVIRSIIFDNQKNAWIGTENGGLNLKLQHSEIFNRFENDLRQPMSFSSKTALCLLEDSQGNIWAGTHHGGVNTYSPKITNFKNYTKGVWNGALAYNDVKAFIETDKGEIWVGSDGGGINVFNSKTSTFTQKRFSTTNKKTIGSDAILDLMKDKNGTIWVCTWGGGLNRYDEGKQEFYRFLHDTNDKTTISSNYPYVICEDKTGLFWVGTFYGGLNTFDPKTGKFKRIIYAADGKSKFTGIYVESIHQDNDGNVWFGTLDGGLNCLTANKNSFVHYFNNTHQDLADVVWAIYTDHKNRLWIGKKGLFLFDQKRKKFSTFFKHPYLVNEQIQSIIEDKKGNLWLGTTNGIIAFNPDTKYIKRYTRADGLQGLEYGQNAAFMSSKGELYFGGFEGFNTFYPDSIKSFDYSYPIYITDLSIFNKSINSGKDKTTIAKYIKDNKSVVLSYDQSVISFDYAALNYVSPKKTNYAYKLEGFDKTWNYVGDLRRATYTNLDPGKYTFYVKASSPKGIWNTKPAFVNIVITPPFYLTWWFKTLGFILISVSIFVILYFKRRQELRVIHEENKEKLHQVQLQFFTNISHEFRTPLTLIMGTLEQVFKMNEDSLFIRHFHTINRNANRLLQLISELMDFRKAESGALKLRVMPGNFSAFMREIADDFKDQAILHDIDFKLDQEKEFSKLWYDRQVLEKTILNILNNAFKYTPDKGKIHIQLTTNIKDFIPNYEANVKMENTYVGRDYLYLIISDSGMGISKNSLQHLFEPYFRVSAIHVGTGIGLAFVKSLIFLHKGSIHVYSEINKGTQIVISIPCNEKDYNIDELWTYQNNDIGVQIESIHLKPNLEHLYKFTQQVEPLKAANKTKSCILFVDDNDELRDFFRGVLEKDYYVIVAKDGNEGIKKAKEASPALIISDVMMPVMDGIEFCRFIKDDFETRHIPFILLTAKDALESRLQGVKSGADYYFSKPVSTELLLETIKNQFNQQQKIKERYLKDYQVEVRDLVHSAKDKDFMDQLLSIIEEKLEESELNIDYVSKKIGVSKSKLYKKIKDITGQSSNEFIRTIRLKKSMEIMTNEDVSITEVMYRVGISSHSYFTTAFKKEFGMTPSKFQQQLDRKI